MARLGEHSPPLTAATVKSAFLWPAMNARALNMEQATLLHDPSPEPDSLVEILGELGAGRRPEPSLGALVRIASRLVHTNRAEGDYERGLAGYADGLATDLRRFELNSGLRAPLAAKSIARHLRKPLEVIGNAAGARAGALVEACRVVAEAIERTPRLQLLTSAVRHELGEQKYRLLVEIVRARQVGGAARSDPPAPRPMGKSHERRQR